MSGRWRALLLAPFLVVACDPTPPPSAAGGACAPPPQLRGDLRPLWTASIEGLRRGTRVVVDGQGNAFFAGHANGPYQIWTPDAAVPMVGEKEAFVVALDPDGRLLWKQALPGVTTPTDIGIDGAGLIYVYGDGDAPPGDRVFVLRLDPSGNLTARIGLPGLDINPTPLFAVAPSGELLVGDAGMVRAYDAAGKERWTRYGERTFVERLAFDGSGAAIVTGRAFDVFPWVSPPVLAPGTGTFVAKLGPDGTVVAASLTPNESPLALSANGTRVSVATVPSDKIPGIARVGSARTTLTALDNGAAPALTGVWSRGFDVAIGDAVTDLAPAPDGGLCLLGEVERGAVDLGLGPLLPSGVLVARVNGAGGLVASALFPGASPEGHPSLAVDGQGNLFVSATMVQPYDFGAGIIASRSISGRPSVAITKMSPHPAPVSNRRCAPRVTGAVLEIESSRPPVQMAMSDKHLVVATLTDVILVPNAGGEPRVLATGQDRIVGVALDAGTVYWAIGGTSGPGLELGRDGRIVSLSVEPGATPKVLVEHQDGLEAFAIDDHRLVFSVGLVNNGSSVTLGKIMSVPLQGGAPAALVSNLVASAPFALAGGELVAAVSTESAGTARIVRIGEDGGETLLALSDVPVTSLAVDATTIYLLERPDPANGWRIRSLPLAGGAPTVVGTGTFTPTSGLVVVGGKVVFSLAIDQGMSLVDLRVAGGAPAQILVRAEEVGAPVSHRGRLAWYQKDGARWSVISRAP